MKSISIEELAYVIQQTKENEQPKPIFFLGAGASKTGGIPLADEIAIDILRKYCKAPAINKLKDEEKSYSKLMECLLPYERDTLLKKYIDAANINVTHIYIAQLMHLGFVDYVLTVNFDNLMLRALALFNEFPATHDMAILTDLTTSTFKEKSVVFLHGQHHGLWLLNTKEEMKKVESTVPKIFDKIADKRPWIFIGYSGNDPIFEHVKKIGRFDNGLYWVAYNDNKPNKKVTEFLETPNTNAAIIKGYDADAFMLKLNSELKLGHPDIINKPFSAVKNMLNNIVDIDDEEHFKGVKERLKISKGQVDDAIQQFEEGIITTSKKELTKQTKIDNLKREIINWMVDEEYDSDKISKAESEAEKLKDAELTHLLAELYYDWGVGIIKNVNNKDEEELNQIYQLSSEKYQRAIKFKPDMFESFNNWGNNLCYLAKSKTGEEADSLFQQAFDKYQQAITIKPDECQLYINWGSSFGQYAQTKADEKLEHYYQQAFDKYQLATTLAPDEFEVWFNWGNNLAELAGSKSGDESEEYYQQAFSKYKKAVTIKPDHYEIWYNWGTYLIQIADLKKKKDAEYFYILSFKKFQKAFKIKSDKIELFNNWASGLIGLTRFRTGIEANQLFLQAIDKYKQAIMLGGNHYNLACVYALTNKKENALKHLEKSLLNQEQTISFVKDDEDWKAYLEEPEFMALLEKYA
jgi:tetratricopeptide (TPR) repeat protein